MDRETTSEIDDRSSHRQVAGAACGVPPTCEQVYQRTQDHLRAKAIEADPAFLAWRALPYEQRIARIHEMTSEMDLRHCGGLHGQIAEVRAGLIRLAGVLPAVADRLRAAVDALDEAASGDG